MIKLTISGACGRMGSRILSLAELDDFIEVVGLLECEKLAGGEISFRNKKIKLESNTENILPSSDVLVEFSTPSATLEHLKVAVRFKKPVVIGTTGFSEEELRIIQTASDEIPIVFSSNMSRGVNLLFKVVNDILKTLKDYDIEIVELHHNQKKDAPSGTAIKLADIVAKNLNKKIIYGREGIIGPRKKEQLGILSVRAGDIIGEHTIYFAGNGERIELTHRAHSRDCFASGAIDAVKWIIDKPRGLYSMQDVFGL